MVHPYLRRRAGEEQVTYPSDAIREVLEKTLGVPLFQEQAMRLAVVAAGFTPGEADQLRRAMAAWRRPGVIEQFQAKLIAGMTERGLTTEFAQRVFQQIRGFGEYGFPESHAASFALLVYVSCWLKYYYPAAFTAALVNSQPMGFYAPAQLIRNAQEHGVEVLPVDVNVSHWDCTLEREVTSRAATTGTTATDTSSEPGLAIRLGLRLVSGFSERFAEPIYEARRHAPFRSVDDFARRTGLPRAAITALAEADAFAALGQNRRQALWDTLAQDRTRERQPLLAELAEEKETPALLPTIHPAAEVAADYRAVGLSLRAHPISFFRREITKLGAVPNAQLATLPPDQTVRVAGLVLVRQRPSTAKGITFITLEDETGVANLVVRSDVWKKFHRAARTSATMLAQGRLQREGLVIHVVATKLEDLSHLLRDLPSQSRDFR